MDELRPGDEVFWTEKGERVRGRMLELDEGLAVRLNAIGLETDETFRASTVGARRVSAVDLLAEQLPTVYHLLPDRHVGEPEPHACACGAMSADGEALKPLSAFENHFVRGTSFVRQWSDMVRNVACELDASNRARPLKERPLPEGVAERAASLSACVECVRVLVLEACWAEEPGRMDDEDLKQFVRDWLASGVWSDRHCRSEDLMTSFMILALMPPPPPDFVEQVGLVWERMSAAGPMAVNGMPMFFSVRFMHKADWERVRPVIEQEEKRRDEIALPPA